MIKIIEQYLQHSETSSLSTQHSPDFSDVSHQMETLKKSLFNTSLTYEAKLELLKEELSSGRYEIQSQSLANKLLEHALSIEQFEPA